MSKTLRHPAVVALALMNGSLLYAQQEQALGAIAYGLASWPESGFGNHRALVDVGAADAPWVPELVSGTWEALNLGLSWP